MSDLAKQIELLTRGSRVTRFHTTPTIKEETVGHHSSIVAGLLLLLWPEKVTVELLRHAIFHDSAEFVTGDVPSPAKRLMDRTALDGLETSVMNDHCVLVPQLSPDMKKIFKFADNLAGIITCVFEMRMGNGHAEEAFSNFCSYFLASYTPADGPVVREAFLAVVRNAPEKFAYMKDSI